MLELNDVLLKGERSTLSMMAREGQLTCLTKSGAPLHATPLRWLYAILGFEPVVAGFISIDGEPLTSKTVGAMRRQMAFAPHSLDPIGEITVYEPPTVQEVFALRGNRQLTISNGLLSEEIKRTGATGLQAQLLAVAGLLRRPILLVDRPPVAAVPYLQHLAAEGRTVIVATNDSAVVSQADNVVETKDE